MNKILLLLLALLISCNTDQKKVKVYKSINESKEIVIIEKDTTTEKEKQITVESVTETIAEKENDQDLGTDDDCIFDQQTQTDKFLRGIKELENYQWDYETKTAKLQLKNGDSLTIYRGGCYHFGVSARMKIYKDSIDYSDWNNVNSKVLWIAKILKNQFAYKIIKTDLDSLNTTIEKLGKGETVYFANEYLGMNNYSIYRELDKDFDLIELNYYRN